MSGDSTTRHDLPLLFTGQAQKELTHNEALIRLDALINPVVEEALSAPPTGLSAASDGLCWLVNDAATGAWQNKDKQIARWSAGSWRYIKPASGMEIWNIGSGRRMVYIQGNWVSSVAIADPAGGSVIDIEARAALNAILVHLRQTSCIPT